MKPSLEDLLRVLLVKGRYFTRCMEPMKQTDLWGEPAPDPPERFKVYDPGGSPAFYLSGRDLARFELWRVIKKDNELAFRKRIDRYYISPRKILSLRKNNPIKRTYKKIRSAAALCQQK